MLQSAIQHKYHHGSVSYEEASSAAAKKAREKLEQRFAQGRKQFPALLDKLESSVPADYLVPNGALHFTAADKSIGLAFPGHHEPMDIHRHALAQLGSRAGVPKKYADLLLEEDTELLAMNLRRRYGAQPSKKYLARVVDGELLGWLSSSYRRFNCAPLVEAFIGECQKFGAVPVESTDLATKFSIKVLLPQVFEPIDSEVLALGIAMRSSDVGDGALSIRTYIERMWCTNGMFCEEGLRRIHLGGRLDDLRYSQRTHELDTETMASATTDVVRALFKPENVQRKMLAIRDADERHISIKDAIKSLRSRSRLTKDEGERCAELYTTADVELLPPVRGTNGCRPKPGHGSAYRFGNALGLLAQEVEPARALELQDLAGEVMGLQTAKT